MHEATATPHWHEPKAGENAGLGTFRRHKGGNAIPYHLEDPFLRAEYEQTLAREGLSSRMQPRLYKPGGATDADTGGP